MLIIKSFFIGFYLNRNSFRAPFITTFRPGTREIHRVYIYTRQGECSLISLHCNIRKTVKEMVMIAKENLLSETSDCLLPNLCGMLFNIIIVKYLELVIICNV